jgi:ferritin-like metal-binding protein YciE
MQRQSAGNVPTTTLKTWAAELGLDQAVRLLESTLAEEKKTDKTLTALAESGVNQHAQAA